MTTSSVRERVYLALSGDTSTHLNRVISLSLVALILLNVVAVTLASVEELEMRYSIQFELFENVSVAIFLVEYLVRAWACTSIPRFRSPVTGRIRYVFTPLAIIDLLSILPTLLLWSGLDLRFLRILRLVRMLRLAKLGRYSRALHLMGRVIYEKRESLVLAMMFMVILVIVSASLMYIVEHDQQPETFSSIPAAMWWGVMTLTTVGYGDIYPVTTMGKLLGAFISICGIAMFALPAGILGSAFFEFTEQRKQPDESRICPHCGKDLDDEHSESEQ